MNRKIINKKYYQSPKGQAYHKKYRKSAKRLVFEKSPARIAYLKKYWRSVKYKARKKQRILKNSF